jgi:GntR family transcriptional repressor for pyruvate dehydrogenase complex
MHDTVSVESRDDLAALLGRRIAAGAFSPGELLPSERVLSEEYGLSRSMVREALRMLAERRLIDVLPGRGSRVREATVQDAVERLIEIFDHSRVTPRYLIEARSMIETTAAALAAERGGEGEIDSISHAQSNCGDAGSVLERVRWDLAFHLAIVRAARNPLVETMFQAIQPYIVELLFRSLTDPEVSRKGLAFHERIFDSIVRRDPGAASREMAGHLTLGITMFGADVDRNLNLVAQDALARLAEGSVTFEDVLRLSRES